MKSFLKHIVVALLFMLSRAALRKYQPKIVAITGNVGKTGTKDAIREVLGTHVSVRANTASFNSEIGVPLTILDLPNQWSSATGWISNIFRALWLIIKRHDYPDWLVLEIGAEFPGSIQMIAEWLPVDILVYTRFPDMPVHVGNFDSPTELIKEKLSLLQSLKPSGTLILNGDDPRVREITDFTDVRAVTYGAGGDTDVRVSRIQNAHFEDGVLRGIQFTMTVDDVSVPLEVRHVIATHHVMNMAAAVAVALEIDVSPEDAIAALADLTPTKGRMTVMDGIKKTTIIDDSYNSSPIAAMEALKVLGALKPAGRRLAVLGDMLELGALTDEAHDEVGEAAGRNADFLIVVGTACNSVIGGALRGGLSEKNILEFETSRLAGKNLERLLEPGDVVLIKGSQGMRMEQVVLEIMAHPEQAQNLLVRQGDEWLKR